MTKEDENRKKILVKKWRWGALSHCSRALSVRYDTNGKIVPSRKGSGNTSAYSKSKTFISALFKRTSIEVPTNLNVPASNGCEELDFSQEGDQSVE